MSFETRRLYRQELRDRRSGKPTEMGLSTPFNETKAAFYADGRLIIDDVRAVYQGFREQYPPYGLVDRRKRPVTNFDSASASSWIRLESAISSTAKAAFDQAKPSLIDSCPYSGALQNLGRVPLAAIDGNHRGLDRLREVTAPGATLAPAIIINILRRVPAMAILHNATVSPEQLARNSAHSLLSEPLHHPQQYARAFVFCLGEGDGGTDRALRRDSFLPDELISAYTQLDIGVTGKERIKWSMPTTDFLTRAQLHIANRLLGSETDFKGDHITTYPIGTRLGDIEVHEPTIGCPGNEMAYEMWDQAIDVIVGEDLWMPQAK